MGEIGFRVVTLAEFRKLGFSKLDPKPKAIFVNRRKIFDPPPDNLRRYNDLMRRFSGRKPAQQREIALRGSSYDRMYRRKILNDPYIMSVMRGFSELAKKRLVYMVTDKDRPDAEIIVSVIKRVFF